MKLIDADELDKVKFHPLPYTHITPSDADAESYKRGWNDAIDAIMSEAPTIEERKKGKWIDMGDFEQCSVCLATRLKEVETYYRKGIWIKTDFCPHCGADMRGET